MARACWEGYCRYDQGLNLVRFDDKVSSVEVGWSRQKEIRVGLLLIMFPQSAWLMIFRGSGGAFP